MNFANALMMTGRSLVTVLVFLFIISVLYDFSTVDGYAALRSEECDPRSIRDAYQRERCRLPLHHRNHRNSRYRELSAALALLESISARQANKRNHAKLVSSVDYDEEEEIDMEVQHSVSRRPASRRRSAPHFMHTPPALVAVDPRCNSETLQRIMIENIDDDLKRSKQNIIEAAEATMGGTFNVICAKSHFSYSNVFTSVTDEASAKNL